jgi:hypothetical protein
MCSSELQYFILHDMKDKRRMYVSWERIIIISIQPLGRFWQEPEPSQATSMALARCILGKFLGVVCHCFPLTVNRTSKCRNVFCAWPKICLHSCVNIQFSVLVFITAVYMLANVMGKICDRGRFLYKLSHSVDIEVILSTLCTEIHSCYHTK